MRIVNCFSKYYASVGQEYANKINRPRRIYQHFMKCPTKNSFFVNPTSSQEINNIVNKLRNKSSCGSDNIANKLLKQIIYEIAKPLERIFNKSIIKVHVPDGMEIATITLIYKGKCKSDISN